MSDLSEFISLTKDYYIKEELKQFNDLLNDSSFKVRAFRIDNVLLCEFEDKLNPE